MFKEPTGKQGKKRNKSTEGSNIKKQNGRFKAYINHCIKCKWLKHTD